jgi:uncharacterized protein YhaN
MKLQRLQIEHYGIFSDTPFEFDSPGFQLIYGPNEAGKSTLLQLIREVLFGFPTRTPYAFREHHGELAASATLLMADGTQLVYRRRKGRKNEVLGRIEPAGHKLDAAALSRLLGGASVELYEQVFGFSLNELASGEKGLQQANLNEALYGGGLGGLANFQDAVADLKEESDGLFTARGSTRTINRLLKRIKETAAAQRKETIKPSEYKKQVAAAAQLGQRMQQQTEEIERQQARASHLQRITAALPRWSEAVAARRELSELAVPDEFPADGASRLQDLQRRREERVHELEEFQQQREQRLKEQSELRLAPQVLAQEAVIRKLSQEVSRIRSFREDIPKRQQEADDQRASVRTTLRQLNPEWDETHLDRFETSLEQRDAILRLQEEADALEQRDTRLSAEDATLAKDLGSLQHQLESLKTTVIPVELVELVEAADRFDRDQEKHRELTSTLRELEAELAQQTAKVRGPLQGDLDLSELLPVPMEPTVEEFRDRWAEAREAVRQAEVEVRRTESDRESKQTELQQLDAREAVPDKLHLQSQRERRDAGWSIIRRRYIESETLAEEQVAGWLGEETAALPDAYERSVAEADRLADERQAKATTVAQRESLQAEAQRLNERLATLRDELSEKREHETGIRTQWGQLWAGCGLQPLSPEAMLDWLRRYHTLVGTQAEHAKIRRQLETLGESLEQFEQRLRAVFEASEEPVERLFKRGRQAIDEDREVHARSKTLTIQLEEKQRALGELQRQREELAADQHRWQGRWASTLQRFEFPATWNVHLATSILNGLTEARGQHVQVRGLEQRVAEMQAGIAKFQSAVDGLCRELAEDLSELPPEAAIEQLGERLEAARQAERDQVRLERELDELSKKIADRQQRLQKLSDDLAGLLEQAGVASEEDFLKIAKQAARRDELAGIVGDALREINVHRSTEDEQAFQAALEQADADAIDAEIRRLQDSIRIAEQQRGETRKEKILTDQALENMEAESLAAGLAMDLESARSELSTAVDRWAPLMLAQTLMKRAIERFERDHQPAMLGEVQRLFRELTLGRYVSIERKLDEHGTLVVVQPDGRRKEPAALSTGTREQLYLAIRLAYILHYCRDAEPLPIVMDDVLVNFDDERAVQTLRVLDQIAAEVQVLFLTCHQHLVDLFKGIRPDATVTSLSTIR